MWKVAGLILAAGESSRMGTPKALLKIGGTTLLEDQTKRLRRAGVEEVFVVVGSASDEIKKTHASLKVIWVENNDWKKGNFSSIIIGLKEIFRTSLVNGVVLLPVDVVGVESKIIKKIIGSGFEFDGNVIPTFQQRGGHPVFLTMDMVSKIVSHCSIDDRLDAVLSSDTDTTRLEVDSKSILNNINTKDDWNGYLKIR